MKRFSQRVVSEKQSSGGTGLFRQHVDFRVWDEERLLTLSVFL